MSKQIITQDIGNGYFLHQINIQTRVLKESIVAPISLKQSKAKAQSIMKSRVGQDLSKIQSYKFHEYVAQENWINNKGQLIKFASIQNDKIVVNPAAIKQFNKYPNNQISFVGNYGRKDAGKSFWYDKILNLSGFDGNHYSNNSDKKAGLYFWNIPFTKGDLKFFLVDYVGYKTNDTLSDSQKKLLDFQLLLAQKFVIIPEPNDDKLAILKPVYDHLKQSKQRFSSKDIKAQKFTPYWPNEIYTLYRTSNPVKKQIEKVGILFEVYNFSIIHNALKDRSLDKTQLLKTDLHFDAKLDIINPKYVKMTSIVFRDIYDKMKGKQYGNIKANGKNIGFLIDQSLNHINNGNIRKMDQVFANVKGDIYDDAVNKSKKVYLSKINHIMIDKRPRSIDQLTKEFDKASRAAYQEFDRQMIDPNRHDQYQKKLEQEINKIEDQILLQNKMKTYHHYKTKLPGNTVLSQLDLQKLKASFVKEKTQTSLDHNDTMILEETLINIPPVNKQGEQIFLPNTMIKRQKELKRRLQAKKKQLQHLKTSPSQLKQGYTQIIPSQSTILEKNAQLKPHQDQFQIALSVLRQKHQKNDLEITQLRGRTTENPQLQRIRSRLRQINVRNSQIEQGLSNINFDRSGTAIRSKSIIRQIKQDFNIKKVVKK